MKLDPSIKANVLASFDQQAFMQTIGASVSAVEYGKVELSLDPRQGLT